MFEYEEKFKDTDDEELFLKQLNSKVLNLMYKKILEYDNELYDDFDLILQDTNYELLTEVRCQKHRRIRFIVDELEKILKSIIKSYEFRDDCLESEVN